MAKFSLKETAGKVISYTKEHWSTPPTGRYMSIKEWVCYCVGGMGAYTATTLATLVGLVAGTYLAVALNINVWYISIVTVISNIIAIVRAPIMATIVDNVRSKRFGKFRVYLAYLALPFFLLIAGVAWVPALISFNTPITSPNSTYIWVIISYTVIYNILQFVAQLYTLGFTTIQQVISPSPEERTNLMSLGVFAYSLGPSIFNAAFPFIANLLFSYGGYSANGVHNIKTFLYIVPAFAALCVGLGLLVAFGTEERMVVPKAKQQKVLIWDGIKMVAKNKYFWLSQVNAITGTLPLLATSFTVMICSYMINNSAAQSLAITILGLAYNPGLLFAPIVIKKIGKKRLALFSNILIAVATVPMILLGFIANESNRVWVGVLMIIISFLVTVAQSFRMVCNSALTSQIYDYQQYKTGVRIEGWLSQFGAMITSAVGIGIAFITPAVYSAYGYTTDASVLYDVENTLGPIIGVMSIIGGSAALFGAIPYLFWDLSEKRHHQIMDILSVRAKLSDGVCDAEVAATLETRIENGEENVLDYFKTEEEPVLVAESADGTAVTDIVVEDTTTDAE